MKRLTAVFVLSALTLGVPLAFLGAEENKGIDVYADRLSDYDRSVFFPEYALGAPDGKYADMLHVDDFVYLDLGIGEEAVGDLTLHIQRFDVRADVSVQFLDEAFRIQQSSGGIIPSGNWTIPYKSTVPYRYVWVRNRSNETVRLDAIEVAELANPPLVAPEPVRKERGIRGSVLKVLDDGNPNTSLDEFFSLLDASTSRHTVTPGVIFDSWNLSQQEITMVGEGTLSGLLIGREVRIRPGTYLIRTHYDPRVYTIDADNVLHLLVNEDIAAKLYGATWQNRVTVIPETTFVRYEIGEAIEEPVLPSGAFVKNGVTFYIGADGKRYTVSHALADELGLSDELLTTDLSFPELVTGYENGGDLAYDDNLRFPF